MRRNVYGLTLCALLYALCLPAQAQQQGKIPRIGILISTSPSMAAPRIQALQKGLRELGYIEGKNIILNIDTRKES